MEKRYHVSIAQSVTKQAAWLKDPFGADGHQPFAERDVMECAAGTCRSVRLDVSRADHRAPLLSFVDDQLIEVGGRAWKCGDAQLSKTCLHLGIGESRIDLLVELVNNLGRRVFRRANARPEARLVARH